MSRALKPVTVPHGHGGGQTAHLPGYMFAKSVQTTETTKDITAAMGQAPNVATLDLRGT